MADWDQDEHSRGWREGRGWRDEGQAPPDRQPNQPPPRNAAPQRPYRDAQMAGGRRDEHPASYEPQSGPYAPGGGGARGYGEGGDNGYGQMSSGSSSSGLGGYGGADVGGWGQPNLNSQWGQGGYAPLNQGLDYGQDGGRFGPAGYDTGSFGQSRRPGPERGGPARPGSQGGGPAPHHDEHHVHFRRWRDDQLANHDRDYSRWREEQTRRYDEDYGSWRNERHSAFSKEFEGWRAGRGGQAAPPASTSTPAGGPTGSSATVNPSEGSVYGQSTEVVQGFAHGANPTLAKIADGHEGHTRHHHHEDDTAARTDEPDASRS